MSKNKPTKSWVCILTTALLSIVAVGSGCSSGPAYKKQAYAKLKSDQTFEYDFPVVWKAIEETARKFKVTDRDPDEVDENELRRLSQRTLETDWIYAQSRDKYQEFKLNGFPKRQALQTRIKYKIIAKKVLGGVNVMISANEEIERLNEDGSSAGYTSADADTSRASELLERIQQNIYSAPPSNSL